MGASTPPRQTKRAPPPEVPAPSARTAELNSRRDQQRSADGSKPGKDDVPTRAQTSSGGGTGGQRNSEKKTNRASDPDPSPKTEPTPESVDRDANSSKWKKPLGYTLGTGFLLAMAAKAAE